MGLGDFFRRRRARESAFSASSSSEALGSFADAEGAAVVGRQLDPGAGGDLEQVPGLADGLATLSQIGPMLQRAISEGTIQVQVGEPQSIEIGDPQTIDMRGTGLREEMFEIMRRHGIDPETGAVEKVDPAAYAEMQREMLAALSRRGIDPGGAGSQSRPAGS